MSTNIRSENTVQATGVYIFGNEADDHHRVISAYLPDHMRHPQVILRFGENLAHAYLDRDEVSKLCNVLDGLVQQLPLPTKEDRIRFQLNRYRQTDSALGREIIKILEDNE